MSGTVTWTTKDKRIIPIKEMETSHLINTMKMIYRNKVQYGLWWIMEMASYIADAPDMAADACEAEMQSLHWLSYVPEQMPHMIVEANRRGVDLSFLEDDNIYFRALEEIES